MNKTKLEKEINKFRGKKQLKRLQYEARINPFDKEIYKFRLPFQTL